MRAGIIAAVLAMLVATAARAGDAPGHAPDPAADVSELSEADDAEAFACEPAIWCNAYDTCCNDSGCFQICLEWCFSQSCSAYCEPSGDQCYHHP
jgi:hypothetical protein